MCCTPRAKVQPAKSIVSLLAALVHQGGQSLKLLYALLRYILFLTGADEGSTSSVGSQTSTFQGKDRNLNG